MKNVRLVDVTDTTVVYTTVVYVLYTTAAIWRHTPTKTTTTN